VGALHPDRELAERELRQLVCRREIHPVGIKPAQVAGGLQDLRNLARLGGTCSEACNQRTVNGYTVEAQVQARLGTNRGDHVVEIEAPQIRSEREAGYEVRRVHDAEVKRLAAFRPQREV